MSCVKAIVRAVLLYAVASAAAPAPARAAERASPAASCKREQDLCRQMYSCRVRGDAATSGADEPYYCQKCQKKLDECLKLAGLQRTVRHAPAKKKRGEVGTTMAAHELKEPKFGTGLATPEGRRPRAGVEADEPEAPAKTGSRADQGRRKRPGSDASGT
jgi:hypothetical protein